MESQGQPQVTPERIMQFSFAFAPPLIIEAGVNNRLFDILDSGPRTIEQIVEETGASIRGMRSIANALVGLGLLAKDNQGRYSLAPDSATFLVRGKPGFRGAFFTHISTQVLPSWLHLSEVVHTGRPQRAVNQESMGSAFFQDFVAALFPSAYPSARALGEFLGVSRATEPVSVLDLAAGSGVWGITLAQMSPQVTVTAVDWPAVIPVAKSMADRFNLAGKFTFVAGDLHQADFGHNHQVAVLGHILHSEGEQRSRSLLKKTYDALAPGGRIAIAEWLVNEDRTGPTPGLVFGVNMLVHTDVGDTFSFGEISNWLREAGFKEPRTLDCPGPAPLITAEK